MNLKNIYDNTCGLYISQFCAKQELDTDFHNIDNWGTINIGEYFFYMSDIRTDIDKNAPKGLIIEWYWEHLERLQESKPNINYESYVMGARFN